MTLQVSYMGTKRNIASSVASVIAEAPPGPMLDLFSGICAIASAVAPSRQIWCNDIQLFAATLGKAFFTSPILPCTPDYAADTVRLLVADNRLALQQRFGAELRREEEALLSGHAGLIGSLEYTMPNVATCNQLEHERQHLAVHPLEFPYRLFSITYSGSYLGLHQCIQIDSIRHAIDILYHQEIVDENQRRWLCLALCQAMSKVATTTGHFAQYLRIKEKTCRRFVAQRRRSVWREWLKALFEISPLGTRAWRSKNRVFVMDAKTLLPSLSNDIERPAVIYADPPYTEDQYSRYYHLYETLLLYDYPESIAIGRYRPNRFRSPYSVKTQVATGMESLVSDCAKLGSRLVLSYPERGLLPNSRHHILSLLKKYYGSITSVVSFDHFHSTLGGSKGPEKNRVKELLFSAG